jgi:hypothetical protein
MGVSYFDQTAHRDVARLWTCPIGTELKSEPFSTLHRGTPARSGAGHFFESRTRLLITFTRVMVADEALQGTLSYRHMLGR